MNSEPPERAEDPFEALLAECLEAFAKDGPKAVEALCEAHPDQAESLRDRLRSLERLGLLSGPEAPHKIGPYRVLRHLGQGGMSDVFLARDERLDRLVALKLGHAPIVPDDRASRRFEREIHAVVRLQHPCIVQTFDVGADQGRSYFTMEYVSGTTLASVIAELREEGIAPEDLTGQDIARAVWNGHDAFADERLEDEPGPAWDTTYVEVVCRLLLDIADGLAHAHAHGIIHRDVKPSNIMVRPDGRAQLFDLGLALLQDQPALSASGDFAGTPFYASPEQIGGRSRGIDGRTDVYSLGVTLYECLSLRRPFEGRTTAEVLKRIQTDEPRLLRSGNPLVPRDLETITLTALEKDPARRYADAEAMAADLRRFLEFRPVRAQARSPLARTLRKLRRNPALALASLLLLTFLVGLPIGLLTANRAIRRQRDRASESAEEARLQAQRSAEVTEFLVGLYEVASADEQGRATRAAIPVEELLEHGVDRIAADFQTQPLVRAALWEATGRAYFNLGMDDEALPLLARSLAERQRELGEEHIEVARLLATLGSIHVRRGDADAAAGLASRSLDVLAELGRAREPAAVENHMTLSACLAREGRLEEARAELEFALDLLLMNGAGKEPGTPQLADALERSGALAAQAQDAEGALERFRRAHGIRRGQRVPDPHALARNLDQQAALEDQRGEAGAASALRQRASGLREAAEAELLSATSSPGAPYPFALHPEWKPLYDARFQEGVTALQSGLWENAISAFRDCLRWRPGHPVCAYNVTCGYSLLGDLERGIEWWDRAVSFGYGAAPFAANVALKDADLEFLRSDPRWVRAHERMLATRGAAEAFAAEVTTYVPASLDPDRPCALLVLLHTQGATRETVLDARWRRLADELELAIVAPSGRIPAGPDPARGMRWFTDFDDFERRPWYYGKPVFDAVHAFAEARALDRRRVFVAGEGLGALVAFDVAVSSPGLFRGALAINGPVHPNPDAHRLRVAHAVGLRLQILVDGSEPIEGLLPDADPETWVEGVEAWVDEHPLRERSGTRFVPAGAPESVRDRALQEAMNALRSEAD